MKKMDEMSRNIKLRSSEIGFKALLLALSAWTLFGLYQSVFNDVNYNPFPTIILGVGVFVQIFSELLMKKKMIDGDDEYKEPNKFLWGILLSVIVVIILLSIGYFLFSSMWWGCDYEEQYQAT